MPQEAHHEHHIYDGEVSPALLVPVTTIIASTTFPGLALSPRYLPTSSWVLDVTNAAAAGTYLMLLEVSNLVGGACPRLAVAWAAKTPDRSRSRWASVRRWRGWCSRRPCTRVRVTIGGATPSLSFASWLTKPGGHVGMVVKPGNLYAVI